MINQEPEHTEPAAALRDEQLPTYLINPTPDNPPWNSWIAVGFFILSLLLIAIVPSLFITPYLLQNKEIATQSNIEEYLYGDSTAMILAVSGTLVAHIITLVCGWLIVTRFNKFSFFKTLGWRMGGFKFWHGFVLIFGVYVLAFGLSKIFGDQDNEMLKILRSSRTVVLLFAFLATFTAPIVEELVYRGVLYSALQRTFSKPAAIAAVTLIFTLIHVRQYYPNYTSILAVLALSLILTIIRARTENLLPCVVFHTVFNGIQSLMLVMQPYLPESLNPANPDSGFIVEKLFAFLHLQI